MSNSSRPLVAEALETLRASKTYVDLLGHRFSLSALDNEERQLLSRLKRYLRQEPTWEDFENYWLGLIGSFYVQRGLTRRAVTETLLWRVAEDLGGRLSIDLGLARMPDYRDELKHLIRTRFKSQREFCRATGISEDMLSHVLAGRKHLAVDTLEAALSKIGHRLRIAPVSAEPEEAGSLVTA
ncbi:MAG TPA: hypothetical protein VML55_24305 [Planctomycetaceae bacterium]|nr:hypothetical protein [Planctomycetaceae bacterium]